jgi:UDP-3-O-[3-hydroxymyristoyl] glucosamine N-acyltransferase
MAYLGCKNPSLALARICEELERQLEKTFLPGIHPLAVIAPTAAIHVSASIGPFCEIGDRVTIGEDVRIESHCAIGPRCVISRGVRLHPRVTLYRDCELGERVIVHSGAVIGCDGYGYVPVDGKQRKLAHVGRTRIGEDVEIGANVTIDRARFAETRIGSGTKIDNLAHIAHNVTTGKDCLIVAQVGIAGSTELGDRVVLGGQVGVAGHLSIGSETQVGAQGGVASNLPAGSRVRGTPAMPISLANRFYVLRKRIPELFHRVDSLEEALGEEQGEA